MTKINLEITHIKNSNIEIIYIKKCNSKVTCNCDTMINSFVNVTNSNFVITHLKKNLDMDIRTKSKDHQKNLAIKSCFTSETDQKC